MKLLLLSSILSFLLAATCGSPKQEDSSQGELQLAFYNVENLFDTINTPDKNDGEFTPGSKKVWNTEKYLEKLDRIRQVLSSIDSNGQLAIVGLAEVENRQVLEDLVSTGFLAERNFQIVHKESPDFRGIDVALLYDPDLFNYTSAQWLEVKLPDTTRTTRDILRADGSIGSGRVALFVNHWPSRWGGTEKSNPKRVAAAKRLSTHLDSMYLRKDKDPEVIIMGDLNDYPNNESVLTVLGADSVVNQGLYNATWEIHKDVNIGTHNYRGHWGVLDQIIVSQGIVPYIDTVYVHKRDFMCYTNKNGDKLPSRSYGGKKYYGGYSDHLPIVMKLKFN